MEKCRTYFRILIAILGVIFGVSAFVIFFWIYENVQAGTWAVFSGVFAAVCLQLHILYLSDKLVNYHTPYTLNTLEILGFVVMVGGAAATIWYIFAISYWHKSILPVKDSLYICAVWSLITMKWGLILFLSSRKYSTFLQRNSTPLSQSI